MCDLGTFIFVPIFHHFNVNDNIIIMLACFSSVSSRIVRAFAKTELVFFSSTLCGVWMYISSAPIRAQMTRCVAPEELGKASSNRKQHLEFNLQSIRTSPRLVCH